MSQLKKVLLIVGSAVTGALLLVSAIVWLAGSHNPRTEAGYVGYLTQDSVFGAKRFIGLQRGPSSPGRKWLLNVENVSITPYTYTEKFDGEATVLSHDNLALSFNVHVVWSIDPEKVKQFVEGYTMLEDKKGEHDEGLVRGAYNNFLREPIRTFARDEIQHLDALDVKDQIGPVGIRILARVRELTLGTPFVVKSVVVGNIQYPAIVSQAVEKKLAATQDLERRDTEIAMAKKDAEKRQAEAVGIAEAMRTINGQLTPTYLQHEAIEAQRAMVNSPNHTTIYIPVGPNGVPVVRMAE